MRLLLDTHTLLWWHAKAGALSDTVRDALKDPKHDVFLSVVSAWEMQIKVSLGKLPLPGTVPELIGEELRENGFLPLSVTFDHVYALAGLPAHHKDPFDRLLVAQARHEGLTLVTDDRQIQQYDLLTLW
ncbi:MAG: type II toxin-antitoxin system VapC family toxin [Bacteroidota bacterium]